MTDAWEDMTPRRAPRIDTLLSPAAPGVVALWAWGDCGSWVRRHLSGDMPLGADALISQPPPMFPARFGGKGPGRGAAWP